MTITVHRAERRKAKLRLAIAGPSGSGKTMGGLLIAKGLVGLSGKILLVDTERGSGDLYGNQMEYDVAPMDPPYTTEKYIEYIKYAEDNGYDCVILDSISHAWNGQGGILEQNSELAARGNNSFTSWAKLTPKQNMFVDAMLNSKIHVIATMRSKTEYAMTPDANGKMKPEKCGSAPIQRDGIDYEFTIVFDVALSHLAEATKDRSGMFNGEIFTIDESIGVRLKEWLENGVDAPTPSPAVTPVVAKPATQMPAQPSVPATPAAPAKTQAPVKPLPKNRYAKSNIDTIRANYVAKGWNTKIFDEAKYNDEVWDADMINADFKKRTDAEKSATPSPAPVQAKPASTPAVTTKCPKCGKPSMTADEAKQMERLVDSKNFDHTLCRDCVSAWWNENKQPKQEAPKKEAESLEAFEKDVIKTATENHKKTIEQPFCVDCGNTRVLPDEEFDSRAKYGVPLCHSCMSKRLAADLKAKHETKPSEKKTDAGN